VKIMDLGIAAPPESRRYLSPEQALAQAADARSDIYSAGVVFHELFTGDLHGQETVSPPRQLKPDLPPEIDAIIMKMMQRDPGRRFQSFAEVLDALSQVAVPTTAMPTVAA
jgi:serine/threonine protein kinase